jgi:hypothetical protein
MQDRSHAYCLACAVADLSHAVVAGRQDAYHLVEEVAYDHQTCHCRVVAVACQDESP